MAAKKYLIPFQKWQDGTIRMMIKSYSEEGEVSPQFQYGIPNEWRSNEEFDADLRLTGTSGGRDSATRFVVKNDRTNEIFSIIADDFYTAVTKFGVKDSIMVGRWKFRKHGNAYGLIPVV